MAEKLADGTVWVWHDSGVPLPARVRSAEVEGPSWPECHEAVTDKEGIEQPCGKPAVRDRLDPEEGNPYPVCRKHNRPLYPSAEEVEVHDATAGATDLRDAIAAVLESHQLEWSGDHEVGYICGCDEDGRLFMPFLSDGNKHQADEVLRVLAVLGRAAGHPDPDPDACPECGQSVAAQERLRDLTRRLGFGDDITEPMADNDTIVAWCDERSAEANEWRESQSWRTDCMLAGHPDDEDCYVHDPTLLRLAALERIETTLALAAQWRYAGDGEPPPGPLRILNDCAADLRRALTGDATEKPRNRPLVARCSHGVLAVDPCPDCDGDASPTEPGGTR